MTTKTREAVMVSQARSELALRRPVNPDQDTPGRWFGYLSLKLRVEEDPGVKTMLTDGTRLAFNPEWVRTQTRQELQFEVGHEVLHCAFRHMYRIDGRDLHLWNIACDHVVNYHLLKMGLPAPQGIIYDPRFGGLSAETIYARLRQEQSKPKPEQDQDEGDDEGDGPPQADDEKDDSQNGTQPDDDQADDDQADDDQPGDGDGEDGDGEDGDDPLDGQTEFVPAPKEVVDQPAPDTMTETDWQMAVVHAEMVSKKAGDLPGEVDRAVRAVPRETADWETLLRRFVEHVQASNYSWLKPNRRYIGMDTYLPSIVAENMPRIVFADDTSASIGRALHELAASALTDILHQAKPEAIEVVYCDSQVQAVEEFTPEDAELELVEMHAKGGGGTKFGPVFERYEDNPPACLIYFTDLENYGEVLEEPMYPVLWLTTEASGKVGEFGETVVINERAV